MTKQTVVSSDFSWAAVLTKLVNRGDLAEVEADWAMSHVMTGDATNAQIAALLMGLRTKGEKTGEVTGLVKAMLRHAVPLDVPGLCVDVVGTGGDHANTVNISTMAAIVVAATGIRVVKHGNRAASSQCGSADVLEALGVQLDLSPDRIAQVAQEVGITFCFAPLFHPAMRHAAPVRRELGIATTFNMLGPLINPARPQAAAVGVGVRAMAPLMAGVLAEQGVSALVFHSEDGVDELTVAGPSAVWEVHAGVVREISINPADLSLPIAPSSELRGGDARHNATIARSVLTGQRHGPIRDVVLLNAAAGLVAASGVEISRSDTTMPLKDRLSRAFIQAAHVVDTGAAAHLLERWAAATHR
ncbi:MAG: anthranilate phosphoribosyltransferase [Actinomycetota bacterium]